MKGRVLVVFFILLIVAGATAFWYNPASIIILGRGGGATDNNIDFAEISQSNDDAPNVITIGDVNSFVLIDDFTVDVLSGITEADDNLTIGLDANYLVGFSVSLSGAANKDYGIAVAVNHVVQDKCHFHRKTGTGNDVGSVSGDCILALVAGNKVTLQVEVESMPVSNASIWDATLVLTEIAASRTTVSVGGGGGSDGFCDNNVDCTITGTVDVNTELTDFNVTGNEGGLIEIVEIPATKAMQLRLWQNAMDYFIALGATNSGNNFFLTAQSPEGVYKKLMLLGSEIVTNALIRPASSLSYDLGSLTRYWRELFIQTITAQGAISSASGTTNLFDLNVLKDVNAGGDDSNILNLGIPGELFVKGVRITGAGGGGADGAFPNELPWHDENVSDDITIDTNKAIVTELTVSSASGTSSFQDVNVSRDLNVVEDFNAGSLLYVDEELRRVSIGIEPTLNVILHVHEPVVGFAGGFRFSNASIGGGATDGVEIAIDTLGSAWLWNYEAGPLRFATSHTERARFTADGNFGIGKLTATKALDVEGEIIASQPITSASGTSSFHDINSTLGMEVGLTGDIETPSISTPTDTNLSLNPDGKAVELGNDKWFCFGNNCESRIYWDNTAGEMVIEVE